MGNRRIIFKDLRKAGKNVLIGILEYWEIGQLKKREIGALENWRIGGLRNCRIG